MAVLIHQSSSCTTHGQVVMRDVLERRGERFVSRAVLTKRRYVLDTKYLGFNVARGEYSEVKTIGLGR
jgi:hypothetical protein